MISGNARNTEPFARVASHTSCEITFARVASHTLCEITGDHRCFFFGISTILRSWEVYVKGVSAADSFRKEVKNV